MAVYQILKLGDEFLRQKSKEVPKITSNILKLLDNLKDTMYDAEGVGLAAPQIGVLKRAIVVDVGEGLWKLINPEIIAGTGEEIENEGCLSIPGRQGRVPRYYSVSVKYLSPEGEGKVLEAEGFLARALQHEIDHLEGILFIDKALADEEEEEV